LGSGSPKSIRAPVPPKPAAERIIVMPSFQLRRHAALTCEARPGICLAVSSELTD